MANSIANQINYSLREMIETPDLNQGFSLDYEEFKRLCHEIGIKTEKKIKRLFDAGGKPESGEAYDRFNLPPPPELKKHFESEVYVAATRLKDVNNSKSEQYLTPRLSIYSYELIVPYLTGEYNILQISDIHFKKRSPQRVSDLANLVSAVKVNPDAVVCTGDIIDESVKDFRTDAYCLLRDLFPMSKRFYVLGNHDYYGDASKIVMARMKRAGWQNITDSWQHDRSSKGSRINFYGLGMPGFHESKIPKTHEQTKETNILLTHSLDALHSGFPGYWDLVMSGHLHAGEIDLWFFDGVDYLMKFGEYSNLNEQKKGWKALSRRTMSYISPGLATHSLMRFRADKAGITLIKLKGE